MPVAPPSPSRPADPGSPVALSVASFKSRPGLGRLTAALRYSWAGLRYACKRLQLNLSSELEERLMNQYRHLSAFPENREVLQALRDRGLRTGILSNGDPAMLDVAVKSAGLGELLDHVISVDSVRKCKTDPEAYALGERATGLPASQIAFVSSNAWDALAATWYGYATIWVNRQNIPFEELGTEPAYTGSTLRAALDALSPA